MKKSLVFALFTLISFSPSTSAQHSPKFAEVSSAGDVYVPYQIVTDGLFVLDVSLTEDGEIRQIDALRDPGTMIGAAKTSIRSWKFQSVSQDRKPEPSRMTVTFVYRPPNYGYAAAIPPKNFAPVLPPDLSDSQQHSDYVPVGILSFAYPDYPVNSVAWGSVVVQLTVNDLGDVKDVAFLHGMVNFNNLVSDALKKWRFQAATFEGKPVISKTVIAFVFQTPSSSD